MQRVAIETPTPISAMVCKDGISNVMDKAPILKRLLIEISHCVINCMRAFFRKLDYNPRIAKVQLTIE